MERSVGSYLEAFARGDAHNIHVLPWNKVADIQRCAHRQEPILRHPELSKFSLQRNLKAVPKQVLCASGRQHPNNNRVLLAISRAQGAGCALQIHQLTKLR